MSKKKRDEKINRLSMAEIMEMACTGSEEFNSDDLARLVSRLGNIRKKQKEFEEQKKHEEVLERKRQEELEAERIKNEHIKNVTAMDLPLDWENIFNKDERTRGVHAGSISDGLILSLTNLGRVDIEYISSITGEDYKTVICALKGVIYQNPLTWGECFFKGWETAEEYLSGNLMRKRDEAVEANKNYNGYFSENITAIEKVMPPSVPTKDIYITLGSPWIPEDIIDDFIVEVLGDWSNRWHPGDDYELFKTKYDPITGSWEIPAKNRYCGYNEIKLTEIYGTKYIDALHLLEKTLNMKTIAVYDTASVLNGTGKTRRVINQLETLLALEKQQKLISEFKNWVWKNSRRKERLKDIFENKFCCVRKRMFDGSFLEFPGMSENIKLYPYQKNAVARIIFTPNTLLSHDVGSGKTFIMIAAGMKLKRMGLSKKNMYVVPNNLVGQWESIFHQMYPNANLLCIEPKSFTVSKRGDVLERICNEDFDGIIIAYSCFESIPLSKDFYIDMLNAQKEIIENQITLKNKATSKLNRKKNKIEELLRNMEKFLDDIYDGTILNDFIQEEINDYSFSPPDRRFNDSLFFLPDFNVKDDFVENILFMIDTSGSMSDDMIAAAFSEIKGAIDQFDGKLRGLLGFFDAAIIKPKPFDSVNTLKIIKPYGGGGTDFEIIFDYVNRHMSDEPPVSIIILTDGYAPFPEESKAGGIPVLWLLNNTKVQPPWGKIATIIL